jgi:endonuclease YncB( thermonuclease family)|tara:strand:+ start:1208 stop:1627 length:420 start_codon:yes stop_codon:yes gene_type:complete
MYEYKCIIRSITDGDGLRVDIDLGFGVVLRGNSGRGVNIRLYGVDAPESRTRNKQEKAHGLLAKKYLQDNLEVGKNYILRTKERGKFGRWLGEIKTKKGLITNLLIKNKLAVKYHGQNKKDIKAAHEINRQHLIKIGLL